MTMSAKNITISLRLSPEAIQRTDKLIPAISKDSDTVLSGVLINRSVIIRLAFLQGLKILEDKYAKPSKKETSQ